MGIGHIGPELGLQLLFNGNIEPAAGYPVGIDDPPASVGTIEVKVIANDLIPERFEVLFQFTHFLISSGKSGQQPQEFYV